MTGAQAESLYHPDTKDFSLVLGGPLFQLFRRAHLCGSALELVQRRVMALGAAAWLPLFIFSALAGTAHGAKVQMPFLSDVDVHVRFLIALPLLILAELVVHQRMRFVVRQFTERELVPERSRAKFDAAMSSALRLRNSVLAETLLLCFVYGVGVFLINPTQIRLGVTSWSGLHGAEHAQPSLAGWWFRCVSLPLFQFLLLRWYFRLFIWTRFLWQVSRLELKLTPLHPDECAGLGFLSHISFALAPLLVAQGALFAGVIADQILFGGAKLMQFKGEVGGLLLLALLIVVGPLLVFSPRLTQLRREALREYGTLAQGCADEFQRKWLHDGVNSGAALLNSPNIQVISNLERSFEIVRNMRSVPFTFQTVLRLAAISLIPLAPLLLTMVSGEELLKRALRIVL